MAKPKPSRRWEVALGAFAIGAALAWQQSRRLSRQASRADAKNEFDAEARMVAPGSEGGSQRLTPAAATAPAAPTPTESFDELETSLGADQAASAAYWALAIMGLTGFVFFQVDGSSAALDFFSFSLPIGAAILAGLTVYFDKRKSRLFVASLFLLLVAAVSYMAIRKHGETATLVAVEVMSVAILARLFAKYCRRRQRPEARIFKWTYGLPTIRGGALMLLVALLILYGCKVYWINRDCLRDSQISSCTARRLW